MQQELLRNLSAIPGHVIACLVQLAWNSASPASVLRLVAALSHPSVRDATLSSTLVRAIKTLKHRMNWRYPKQQAFLFEALRACLTSCSPCYCFLSFPNKYASGFDIGKCQYMRFDDEHGCYAHSKPEVNSSSNMACAVAKVGDSKVRTAWQ